MKRRLQTLPLIAGICVPAMSGCTSFIFQSPPGDHRVVLGAFRSHCPTRSEKKQWAILYGTLPLNRPDFSEILRNPDQSIRITETAKWQDVLINIFGGSLLSLTRKTITVELCNEAYIVRTPEQIETERKQMLQAALDLYLMEWRSKEEESVVLVLNSGETKVGRIVEVNAKEIVISIKQKAQSSRPADRVILREGGVLLGDVVRQDTDRILIATKTGVQEIDKRRIQMILFHKKEIDAGTDQSKEPGQPAEQAMQEKKAEFYFETIHINRNDIRRIILSRDLRTAVTGQEKGEGP